MADILVRAVTMPLRMAPDEAVPEARVITGRVVPYGQVASVVDVSPDGQVDRYQEAFAAGAFMRQVSAAEADGSVARRVTFVDQHSDGLGKLGYGLSMREEADGLYLDMRVLPDKVRSVETLLADGVDGLSIGYVPVRTRREEGVRVRTRASLIHVALEPQAAYAEARVLAMRSAESELAEEEALERAWQEELDAWMAQDAERREALAKRLRPVS